MQEPQLLWVHVAQGSGCTVAKSIADEHFSIEFATDIESAALIARRVGTQAVCWEFEDAEVAALRAMRDFKVAHPALPILMLTTQHSEALAVWAFRARVWNYVVKPVPASELRANFSAMALLVRDTQEAPRSVRMLRTLLPEDVVTEITEAPTSTVLRSAVARVERSYDQKIRQSDVAASCGMSVCKFSRAFKAVYSITFSEYLMRFRIARACRLLRQGTHNATAAGLAVGFDDPSHFARAFRNLLGVAPSVYKREQSLARRTVVERRRSQRAVRLARSSAVAVQTSDALQPGATVLPDPTASPMRRRTDRSWAEGADA